MNHSATLPRPAGAPPAGVPASPDQASRLRAMVEALRADAGVALAPADFAPAPAPTTPPPPAARPAPSAPPTVVTLPTPAAARAAAAAPPSPARAPAAAPARRAPVVAITSGKGGVGKTCVSVNLAIALAARGLRVTLLDADLGLANADLICGITPSRRLEHALATAGTPSDALASIAVMAPGGFRLIPGSAGVSRMADLPRDARQRLIDALAALERDSDVVLIDTGAGLHAGVTAFVSHADHAVVVSTPDPTAIADAYAMCKCVLPLRDGAGRPREGSLSLLVNQASDAVEGEAVHDRINAVARRFLGRSLPLLGTVRADERAALAVRERRPVRVAYPRAKASRDLDVVAAALTSCLGIAGVGASAR